MDTVRRMLIRVIAYLLTWLLIVLVAAQGMGVTELLLSPLVAIAIVELVIRLLRLRQDPDRGAPTS